MIDVQFPVIDYAAGQTPREWGRQHGEQFREAIREVAEIRRGLMLEKNPRLGPTTIPPLAQQQWVATEQYDAALAEELRGIAEGAAISIEQLVILNNYTDFRDIQIDDQGCSAIYVRRGGRVIAGQTWDMHGSARRYLCCLRVPGDLGQQLVLSIVGCVGMMGFAPGGRVVGVNNLNTAGARPGILWPVLIRRLLAAASRSAGEQLLRQAPLTSGRSLLLGDRRGERFGEVMPGLAEQVATVEDGDGAIWHTNHCLGTQVRAHEMPAALTSTTHERYDLLAQKIEAVTDFQRGWELLNDHENYPRSICSNYQTNSQDPSITCGGAVGDLVSGQVRMWRGDVQLDPTAIVHNFQLSAS